MVKAERLGGLLRLPFAKLTSRARQRLGAVSLRSAIPSGCLSRPGPVWGARDSWPSVSGRCSKPPVGRFSTSRGRNLRLRSGRRTRPHPQLRVQDPLSSPDRAAKDHRDPMAPPTVHAPPGSQSTQLPPELGRCQDLLQRLSTRSPQACIFRCTSSSPQSSSPRLMRSLASCPRAWTSPIAMVVCCRSCPRASVLGKRKCTVARHAGMSSVY